MLIARKKKFLMNIIGAAVLVLSFWLAQPASIADAANEIYCYTPTVPSSCKSNAEDCFLCSGYTSTCTVNSADDNIESGFPAFGTLSSCDFGGISCKVGSCSSINPNFFDGDPCTVRKLDGSTVRRSSGNWDLGEKKCVVCTLDNIEIAVCGTTSAIFLNETFPGSGIWQCGFGADFKFESACGAALTCDEKGAGDACTGGTCNATGQCVAAAAITVSANPNSVVQNATNDIVFTVSENGAKVSISGAGVTPANCTVAGGTCTIFSVKATAAGAISVTAAKTSFTSGTTAITVTPAGAIVVTTSPSSIPASTNKFVTFFVTLPVKIAASVNVALSTGQNCTANTNAATGAGTCSLTVNYASNIDVTASLSPYPNGTAIITVAAALGCTAGTCNGVQWCPVTGGAWANCAGGRVCLGAGVCGFPGATTITSCTSCDASLLSGGCNDRKASGQIWAAGPPACADADIQTMCNNETVGNGCIIGLSSGGSLLCSTCLGGGPIVSFSSNCYQKTGPIVAATATYSGAAVGPNDTIILYTPSNSISSCMQVTGASGTSNYNLNANGTWTVKIHTGASCATPGAVKVSATTTVQAAACAAAGETNCTDTIDNDSNGQTDCADSACSLDPACVATPCGGAGMYTSPLGPGYCTIEQILAKATSWILALVSSIIILIIIIGGLMYISSAGDEERLRTSKNMIFYAIVGLAIILVSYALITEVTNLLKGT